MIFLRKNKENLQLYKANKHLDPPKPEKPQNPQSFYQKDHQELRFFRYFSLKTSYFMVFLIKKKAKALF